MRATTDNQLKTCAVRSYVSVISIFARSANIRERAYRNPITWQLRQQYNPLRTPICGVIEQERRREGGFYQGRAHTLGQKRRVAIPIQKWEPKKIVGLARATPTQPRTLSTPD